MAKVKKYFLKLASGEFFFFKFRISSWIWWHAHIISALGRLRQEDCYEFRASLNYTTTRPCVERKREREKKEKRKGKWREGRKEGEGKEGKEKENFICPSKFSAGFQTNVGYLLLFPAMPGLVTPPTAF